MNIKEYISSGILEEYVLGTASKEDSLEVERMVSLHPEIRKEIEEISKALEQLAIANSVSPARTVKPFLMATIDYMHRLEHGEPVTIPPILTESSRLTDFSSWLNRHDMVLPDDIDDLYAKIIGHTPEALTAIVWIKKDAPPEVHYNEHEKFLITEGTCDIIVEKDVYHLVPGDYFSIPLYKSHAIKVTSDIPCKVILQRLAA
jgi:mannose-6-phosphate isomerase-like protein (cupin superfamily)